MRPRVLATRWYLASVAALASTEARLAHADVPAALVLSLPGRLVGGAGASPAGVGRAPRGVLVGVDGGPTFLLGRSDDPARLGAGFGARLGYAFRSGIDLEGRYDWLGVSLPADPGRASASAAVLALRYTVPFLVPSPFVEAGVGAMLASEARPTTMAGLGLAIPVAAQASVDVAARSYFVDDRGLHSIVGGRLGLTIHF